MEINSLFNKLRSIVPFLFFSLVMNAQLVINEIMTNNVSFIMDDAYNFSMWVEVYNTSATQEEDIAEYFFTDNTGEMEKWQPLSNNIPPGGYCVLWFERDDREGHASFKLKPEGGLLYLINKSHEIVDVIKYPQQYRNISFGRQTDGASYWNFFDEPSPGASNNNKKNTFERCLQPVFSLKNGFYDTPQVLTFNTPPAGETICYTTDNTEPLKNSNCYIPGTVISLDSTLVIRAKSFGEDKLSSDVVTSTFFIKERKPALRVVSISTDQRYLTNDTIGIYCDGTNGITGNLQKTPKNFNQEWDRPVNFEFFDESGKPCLNQELDIRIVGGGSRESALKSIAVAPKKKFGDNLLRYDFFKDSKPGLKYEEIQMRNSGNDFKRTMMKDAFLQSIVMHRMDVDYEAYEPAVIFINGVYCGIENMRERANKSYVFSNYGLDNEDVYLIEATYKGVDSHNDIPTDPEFQKLSDFLRSNTMTDDVNYQQACKMIDVNEFINYLMLEIFCANVDWPYNNVKMWRKTENGKWRWILMDVEYSYSMGRVAHNTITFALGENTKSIIGGYSSAPEWSTVVFAELIKNESFRNKFIDRFCIHISTTFATNRTIYIADSLAAKIRDEIPFHQARYNIVDNFQNDLNVFHSFSTQRPANVLSHISERFLNSAEVQTISIKSDTKGASYKLNSENIIDPVVTISYYKERNVAIEARPVKGYQFDHWMLGENTYPEKIYTGIMNGNIELTAVYEPYSEPVDEIHVFINEVVSSNQLIYDEVGEADDYIELYNAGSEDVDIAGWYLTDNLGDKTMVQIPETKYANTIVPAHGWKVLWADGQPEQGPLHLGFKISSAGEPLAMYKTSADSTLKLVDYVYTPFMSPNTSYSRVPDGSTDWIIQGTTCNISNMETVIYNIASNQIKIYPTVFTESFNIQNATGLSLIITDLNGRVLYGKDNLTDDNIISANMLQRGMYLVIVGKQVIKVIKQ